MRTVSGNQEKANTKRVSALPSNPGNGVDRIGMAESRPFPTLQPRLPRPYFCAKYGRLGGGVGRRVLPPSPGREVCWSQRGTSRRGRLEAHGPERSRSGKGYAVDRDWGARVDAERHGVCRPHCPAPVTAGEACSKACWENGGLSGRRGRPGSSGVGRAGEPLGKRKVEGLGPESGKGRYWNPRSGC
ncbi:hypothetical protein H8959_000756 [Pygathrix nigripes]